MLGGSFVPNKYQRLTAEREVAGLNPGTGPTLRVLKCLRNEGTAFSLYLSLAGPRMSVPSPVGDVKIVSPISNFRAKCIDTQIKGIFPILIIRPFISHSLWILHHLTPTSFLVAAFFGFWCMRFISIPTFNFYFYVCIPFLKWSDSVHFVIFFCSAYLVSAYDVS